MKKGKYSLTVKQWGGDTSTYHMCLWRDVLEVAKTFGFNLAQIESETRKLRRGSSSICQVDWQKGNIDLSVRNNNKSTKLLVLL